MSTQPNPAPELVDIPYNEILGQKHGQLKRAQRLALGTVCDVAGKPIVPPRVLRRQLKFIRISAAVAGDNVIIPAGQAGQKDVLEVVMWNVTGPQTIIWQQGQSNNNPIILFQITGMPSTTGFTLGFNGNWDMPHWELDNGQPLILNLSAGTQVDGFIRYRVQNGTS